MYYVCVADGFSKRNLIPADDDIYKYIKTDKDYYKSVFLYNEEQYAKWKSSGSVAGITNVVTNRLVWDFDNAENVEQAKEDAKVLCSRLIEKGIPADDIQIAFSGMKGFSVEVQTNQYLTPEQLRSVNLYYAEGLPTNDTKILDHARIFRVLGTKHNKTGLFKFPLTLTQLSELPVSQIKDLAKDIENANEDLLWHEVTLPEGFIPKAPPAPSKDLVAVDSSIELNFKFKPKGFSNCKFALLNGHFKGGVRNHVMMALAATCKAQGYPKEIAYNMLKGAARLQAERTNTEAFPKKEIWNNVIEVVYGDHWKGAQYSCKTQPWLKEICDSLGPNRCKHAEEVRVLNVTDMSSEFEYFSKNIDKNTVKTGIVALDENIQLTVGMPVALLGAPSSGKSSLSLNILNNTSKAGISSVFFSMDMYGPLVFMKQIQKLEGLSPKQIHHIFKHEPKRALEIKAKLSDEYKNVKFSLKSGLTVADMRDIINEQQDATGEKVKLVLIDYLECIAGPYSDPTANMAKIALELKDFATEMDVCGITLVQPPKSAGDASYPLTSMRQIKGSSMLEQSFRAVLSIYREGFGPNRPEDDKYITINALKNTMGPLFSVDNYWDGSRGEIRPLDETGEMELAELRKRKAAMKADTDGY